MRPRKVTVVLYMIIYINIYIYIDSVGVDRTRRGSLRLAPISLCVSSNRYSVAEWAGHRVCFKEHMVKRDQC